MSLTAVFHALFAGFSTDREAMATLEQQAAALDQNSATSAESASLWWQRAAQVWKSHAPATALALTQVEAIETYYRALSADDRARGAILKFLAMTAQPAALRAFVTLITQTPPTLATDTLLAFAPLFQVDPLPVDVLYPALFDGLSHPVVAGAVLDLANFLARSGRVTRHPATGRTVQLANLLGALVQQLQRVEENPQQFAATPQALTVLVGDCVGLIVALCNALALVGDDSVTGKLHQALMLSHRVVRCESAAALAKLGDKAGIDMLLELAAFPLVRSRALVYLDELGAVDKVESKYTTPVARAEGALVAWLAQPTQFGAAPTQLELIDECRQAWPGFDEPVDCFLFDVGYRAGEQGFSTIALAGPSCDLVTADLEDFPPSDIYAIYAGRSAEHEELSEAPADELSPSEQQAWHAERERLIEAGYAQPELAQLGRFFGSEYWVATAQHEGRPGVVIGDGQQQHWLAVPAGPRAIGPQEAYWLFKGRLLREGFRQ